LLDLVTSWSNESWLRWC